MHKYTEATGVNGVLYRFNSGRYVAQITIGDKYKSKTFDTLEEAANQRGVWENEKLLHDIANKSTKERGNNQNVCTNNCLDCKYSKWLNPKNKVLYCDYCSMENKLRGCVAGDSCNKKALLPPQPKRYIQKKIYK